MNLAWTSDIEWVCKPLLHFYYILYSCVLLWATSSSWLCLRGAWTQRLLEHFFPVSCHFWTLACHQVHAHAHTHTHTHARMHTHTHTHTLAHTHTHLAILLHSYWIAYDPVWINVHCNQEPLYLTTQSLCHTLHNSRTTNALTAITEACTTRCIKMCMSYLPVGSAYYRWLSQQSEEVTGRHHCQTHVWQGRLSAGKVLFSVNQFLFMLPFVVGQSVRQPSQSSKVCICGGGGGAV